MSQASPIDSMWGIGFDGNDAKSNYAHWGLSLLKQVLMKVKYQIREGSRRQSKVTERNLARLEGRRLRRRTGS